MSVLQDGELETAAEMRAALQARDVAAVELVERALERVDRWQPATNAFSQIWKDAVEEARALDEERVRRSADPTPLLGVPIALKDLFDVAGRETTGCSRAYRGRVASRDATVVTPLRQAGLLFVGKTNQHELAAGGTNLVSACGQTRNPWAPSRMTGGSSGGSAAAVAAGIVPWSLGSDTGGSIRIPASMCGTFGLKPTTGRFPIVGMLPLGPSLDCPGPMAATSGDVWTLYQLMDAGREPGAGPPPLRETEGAFRVGVPAGFFSDFLHPEVAAAVEATASTLAGTGGVVEPVEGRGIEDARRVWWRICYPEFAGAHPGIDRSLLHPTVRAWMEEGEQLSAGERADAARRREEIRRWFQERLVRFDALLIPTTPYPAPLADQEEVDLGPRGMVKVREVGPGWITCSVNLAGLPAVNLPAVKSSGGLPIGVSLVGGDGEEERILRLAASWEAASGYRPEPPPVPA